MLSTKFENRPTLWGGGPEKGADFGDLSSLTLFLTRSRMGGGKLWGLDMITEYLNDLTDVHNFFGRPVRGPSMGTKPSRRKFWDFSVLFDAKSNPSKTPLSEIHLLLSISLPSSSILRKNEALTPKIDRERNRRSKARR